MPLDEYRKKRDFAKTPEPAGRSEQAWANRFVVHEHHATRLHFDLRLEMDGVLKSWAIPKGPSMNPADKRLSVMVEDHPLEYLSFRGEIAEGNYGAGRVEIWDSGTYRVVEGSPDEGKMVFEIEGTRLEGAFHFVKLRSGNNEWLLIKGRDEYADSEWKLEQVIEGGSRRDIKERRSKEAKPDQSATPADPMPDRIVPMQAVLGDKPFSNPDWLFEQKWDGFRAVSFISPGSFRLVSRRQGNLLDMFPQARAVPGLIDAETAILDGEIVALDETGKPKFQLLQNAADLPHGARIVYYVFDLLYLNGVDLRKKPLIERKEALQTIIRPNEFLRYSDHVIEHGEQLYRQAEQSRLEGIMAKRLASPYVAARTRDWLKLKIVCRQEFVIGGYTQPRRSRESFGSLVIGVYDGERLVFAGQIGTGFDDATLRDLYGRMQPLRVDYCPFDPRPKTNEPATWVQPKLVCEAKFTEWTDEGILRQPVYLGLRPDKRAADVIHESPKEVAAVVETEAKPKGGKQKPIPVDEAFSKKTLKGDLCVEVDGAKVSLTNLDKVYWPDEGYTKGDMLRYYYQVHDIIVPHLAGRPLILRRFPNGAKGESFYQQNVEQAPDYVTIAPVEQDESVVNHAVIDSTASLLYVANLGCIAQNPLSSRAGNIDKPDWFVLDLDPEQASFGTVCEVAMVVKEVLDELGLAGYPKTSGSRGLHVYVPLQAVYTHQQVQDFAELAANIVASRVPKIATTERMKKQRTEAQVYVDYLQNAFGKSMTSPYSVRAAPGATVSTPLTWDEVAPCKDKAEFTMFSVPERVAKIGDIFRDVLTNRQTLVKPMQRLEKLLGR